MLKIPFPKTMYWTGKNGPRFIRPIRWIVALLGNEVIPFEIAGVKSGNVTSGHRRLGARSIVVTTADYALKLRDNFVILSADERRKKIQGEITAGIKPDPSLLETLTYLTEYPTPITGDFDPSYLDLPEEVLVTVMRHHQKYFSVVDAQGKLTNHFVAVMQCGNIDADREGLVKRGNERVLRARFNDARFFWNQDQHKKLADRVQDLANVTFQAKLGSYLAKTERVVELAAKLKAAMPTPQQRGTALQGRPHYGTRQGIHRTAGRGRRTLCTCSRRTGRSRGRHLRSVQAGQHGGLDPAHECRTDRFYRR